MNLIVWLPVMFLLGIATFVAIWTFLFACDRV
jgi:hypothetical protein